MTENTTIDELLVNGYLSTRTYNVLINKEIQNVKNLIVYTKKNKISSYSGFGEKSITRINRILFEYALSYRKEFLLKKGSDDDSKYGEYYNTGAVGLKRKQPCSSSYTEYDVTAGYYSYIQRRFDLLCSELLSEKAKSLVKDTFSILDLVLLFEEPFESYKGFRTKIEV